MSRPADEGEVGTALTGNEGCALKVIADRTQDCALAKQAVEMIESALEVSIRLTMRPTRPTTPGERRLRESWSTDCERRVSP